MKSIKNNEINTIIINKSKFICLLFKVDSLDDISKNLNLVKSEYKDATHHCYAYILDNIKRFSDDKEPSGTAGMPILNVLEKSELNHVLAIVVRYFGGIKLGAGGLVRAYTNSVKETIDKSEIVELKNGYKITIEFDYNDSKRIDNLIKNCIIINKQFDDKVIYELLISEDEYELIKDNLNIVDKKNILI